MFELDTDLNEEYLTDTTQSSNGAVPSKKTTTATDPAPTISAMEQQLRKLAAADLPSHRSAWKGGKGFQNFTRQHPRPKARLLLGEGENHNQGTCFQLNTSLPPYLFHSLLASEFAISLPIAIGSLPWQSRIRRELEPKTSLVDRPGVLVPPLRAGIQTISNRDAGMSKSMDPGPALAMGDDDDDADSEDDDGGLAEPDKGMRTAMKILHKQSLVPDEGMWRSLAS